MTQRASPASCVKNRLLVACMSSTLPSSALPLGNGGCGAKGLPFPCSEDERLHNPACLDLWSSPPPCGHIIKVTVDPTVRIITHGDFSGLHLVERFNIRFLLSLFLDFNKTSCVPECLKCCYSTKSVFKRLPLPLMNLTKLFCLHSKHLDCHHPLTVGGSQTEVLL